MPDAEFKRICLFHKHQHLSWVWEYIKLLVNWHCYDKKQKISDKNDKIFGFKIFIFSLPNTGD